MRRLLALGLAVWTGVGCATPIDHGPFRAHRPRSILVLPPLSEANDVSAPYDFLAAASLPIAEAGYYVFPVAVIDSLLKRNGLPEPGEMHEVPPERFHEILGADAVLYVVIEDWGQKYWLVQSESVVRARARLVDARSGLELWKGRIDASQGSGAGGDPIVMLIAAFVTQVLATSAFDGPAQLAGPALQRVVFDENAGFLLGPYHPEEEGDPRGR